ncbi:hypothetical protein TRICI_000074 [Trichomonascus ciferrii]|uniref:Cyclin-domain-containing protein n=1 Tax=Trichomonascus ciferrii TaxID=44093 RepID=A0A642VEG4_9ASCO|nr:hypothetical protein TRICI_000074 [Trichomonascus ciferrii]
MANLLDTFKPHDPTFGRGKDRDVIGRSLSPRQQQRPTPQYQHQYHYFHRQQASQEEFNRQLRQGQPVGIPVNTSTHNEAAPFPRSHSVNDGRTKLPPLRTTLPNGDQGPFSASATTSSFFSPTAASRLAPHTNEPSAISSSYTSAPLPPSSFDGVGAPSSSDNRTSLLSSRLQQQQQQPERNGESPKLPPEPALAPRPIPQPSPPSSTADSPNNTSTGGHLDIANHPVPDVIVMLTALLQKIIDANDALQNNNNSTNSNPEPNPSDAFSANVLAFHGRNIPAISLHAYLSRILKYCPTTNEVFISLLVYFDRIAQRANSKTNTSQMFVMDSYNIHRLIIAGVTVASKFFSDVFYKNSRYAKVGGLPAEELNHLELQFLLLTNFRLMISLEELQRYADLLLRFWEKERKSSSAS